MKWQAIAGVTSQVKELSKDYLIHKLQKDASVEIPHLWGDFESETTQALHDSQSHIEVMPNDKTGGLSCLTKFDELHPDFLENNNKPFKDYILDKYDERAKSFVNIKNPFTKKSLESKAAEYRNRLSQKLLDTEINLVEGKRNILAIEGVEKYKKITYDNPQSYEANLNDCINSFNALSLLPIDKERRINEAKLELAGAASLGMLKNSPDTLINQVRLPPESQPLWIQHLSLEQRVKLDNQLKTTLEHRQIMRQHEVGLAIKSNRESILATGEHIKAIDNLVTAAYGNNSRQYEHFKQEENFYKQAFSVTDQIKHVSIENGGKLVESLKPMGGDPDFYYKQQIYNIALKSYEEQLRQASVDPARLAEELNIDEFPKDLPFQKRILLRKILQEQKGIPDYARQNLLEK
ncbi:MAG TPA: hypothetical protein LFW21_01765 [Rickettsia endosymbiont of Pyrocoelia pectoralis]|nr:hypothetical protein [Rickettsia endosymbiont of Pyrocoelia pectoralis]